MEELLGPLLEFVFTLLGEVFGSALSALWARAGDGDGRARSRGPSWVMVGLGCVVLGAALGGISLLVLPALWLHSPVARAINLLLAPVAAGGLMEVLGNARQRQGRRRGFLMHFGCAYLFALAFAVVRFAAGQ
jgi:hypothetical protein